MQASLTQHSLNPAQIHFLRTLQFVKTEKMMQELQQVVSDFFLKKIEEEADKWWEENDMTNEKLKELSLNFVCRY